MFNLWKSRKTDIENIADEVSRRVFLILAFPRSLYENIPNSSPEIREAGLSVKLLLSFFINFLSIILTNPCK